MKLSIRRIATVLLLSSILLGSFLYVLPANAAISPNNNTGTFYFMDSGNKTILFIGKAEGKTINIQFNFAPLPLTLVNTAVKNRPKLFKGYSNIYSYRLLAGNGSGNSLYYKAYTASDGAKLDNAKPNDSPSILNKVGPVLVLGKKEKSDAVFKVLGLYGYTRTFSKVALVDPSLSNDATKSYAALLSFSTSQALNILGQTFDTNDANFSSIHTIASVADGEPNVMASLSGTDLKSQCGQLSLAWGSMQNMVRDFFYPLPAAQSESPNPNWSNDQNLWSERLANGTEAKNFLKALAQTYLSTPDQETLDKVLGGDKQYSLTKTGAANAAAIHTKAGEIKNLISLINNSKEEALEGGTQNWKCGSGFVLSEFKWNNKTLSGNRITTMEALSKEVDKLLTSFTEFEETTESSNGEAAQCTPSSTDSSSFAFIREAMCGLLVLVKGWTDSFFETAVNWLKASLGVTDDSTLTTPADTSTTPSPGTGTSTPSTTNTTTTPATSSTTPSASTP